MIIINSFQEILLSKIEDLCATGGDKIDVTSVRMEIFELQGLLSSLMSVLFLKFFTINLTVFS